MRKILLLCCVMILTGVSAWAQDHGETRGIAVLDLQANGVAETEVRALSDVLRSSILKTILEQKDKIEGTYKLIERSQMDKIFAEFDVQSAGCTDVSCAIEFGEMLNAERIIIGSVGLVGSTFIVVARIVDVESSTTLVSVNKNAPGPIDNVIKVINAVGYELLTGDRIEVNLSKPEAITGQTAEDVKTITKDSFLSVTSVPEGANVYIDDREAGVTPLKKYLIAEGYHKVQIIASGFKQYSTKVSVDNGEDKIISHELIAVDATEVQKNKRAAFDTGSQRIRSGYGEKTVKSLLGAAFIWNVVSGIMYYKAIDDYHSAKDKYLDSKDKSELRDLYYDVGRKYDKILVGETRLKYSLGTFAGLYFVERLFFSRAKKNRESDASSIDIDVYPAVSYDYNGVFMNVRF